MADPLSITASIIAVGGAANVVAKGTRLFLHIARDADSLAEDAKFFASHISIFGGVISSVRNTIQQHFRSHPRSPTLTELEKCRTLPKLNKQVELLMQRVESLQPRIKAHGAGLSWKARLVWAWEKPKREELCIWVERVQVAFLLIVFQVNCEALRERASSERISAEETSRLRRHIKDQNRLMKTHMEAMRALQTRLDHFRKEKPWHCEEGLDNVIYDNVEVILLELGENSIAKGKMSHRLRSSDDLRSIPISRVTAEDSGQNLVMADIDESSFHSQDESHDLADVVSLDTSTSPKPNTIKEESDYISVQPLPERLFCDPVFNVEAINGYVGDIHCSAMINRKFPENIISLAHAKTVHASIEEFEGGSSPTEIGFGSGRYGLVCGKASFRWKQSRSSSHLKPLKITCNICDHPPYSLIFGEEFLRRRQHYWHRS